MPRRFAVVVAVAVALVLTGRLLLRDATVSAAAQQQPPRANPRLNALRQERVAVAKQALELVQRQFDQGLGEDDELATWQRRLYEAEVAAAPDKAGRVAAAERHVNLMRQRMDRMQRQLQAGQAGVGALMVLKYELACAECALEELTTQ